MGRTQRRFTLSRLFSRLVSEMCQRTLSFRSRRGASGYSVYPISICLICVLVFLQPRENFMRFRFTAKSHECPGCGSRLVHQSHKRSVLERIACLALLLQPYRCDNCGARFFQFARHKG
jgi:predicted RNA-binding Zn-ribbon protein involved in translation (DUF1610 family)